MLDFALLSKGKCYILAKPVYLIIFLNFHSLLSLPVPAPYKHLTRIKCLQYRVWLHRKGCSVSGFLLCSKLVFYIDVFVRGKNFLDASYATLFKRGAGSRSV